MLVTTRLVLNNWHYINEKTLSFNQEINFFTGHSGSGKSTVLDAIQVLLYADTDGRGFFNKAAKDDSNRTLMEYLRGMNNVKDNGDASYLRNKNFSSTIAMEFYNTETKAYQVVGVAFDVEVASNDIDRMFFWHHGPLLENGYRYDKKTMTINQLKEYLKRSFSAEDWWFSRTNDKFRARLYDTYLGGLDERKFPMLFKKAISFRMDTKLEDFVKEFICVEKDIHIEDMQESVVQYVRLKRKLDDTKKEIGHLVEIKEQYSKYAAAEETISQLQYNLKQLELDLLQQRIGYNQEKQQFNEKDLVELGSHLQRFDVELKKLQEKQVEVKTAIKNSGFEHLQQELKSQQELLLRIEKSKVKLDQITSSLTQWNNDILDASIVEEMASLFNGNTPMTEDAIGRLHEAMIAARDTITAELANQTNTVVVLNRECTEVTTEIAELKSGKKAYPVYLTEARDFIAAELEKRTGKSVAVEILADLIDIKDTSWQDAIEGFMSNHKLTLIVEPEHVKEAMMLYGQMDAKKYHKVSLVDTEKVLLEEKTPVQGALSEEVSSSLPYVTAYVNRLMGAVVKCNSHEKLREQRSGITRDCVLYHGYRIQHIDPKHYQQFAYIGQSAIERRLLILEEKRANLLQEKTPMEESIRSMKSVLNYEYLNEPAQYYMDLSDDVARIPGLTAAIQSICTRIEELKTRDLSKWKEEELQLEQAVRACSENLSSVRASKINKEKEVDHLKQEYLMINEEMNQLQANFVYHGAKDESYRAFLRDKASVRLDRLRDQLQRMESAEREKMQKEYDALTLVRDAYRSNYAFRGFSVTARDNDSYDVLLEKLQSDKLQEFTVKAAEQAKKATSHFKTDFIYKIRDAIKEAMQQKEDLNQILKQTDFGKEKYRFVIEKNKGEDGKFYTMFMDENLEINPNRLSNHMENQVDLFSSNHEDQYSELINELIDIFMPPEDCSPEQLEEARRNIEKYADYRTYLAFDMEQIIEGMPPMRLSKMLTKNSGGEGQNPLYVALLASFAQVYKISLRKNTRRRLTPRLVILDEAFSKMDGEKVASCVELIRKLGFQAIISATNDKMQNYVESVDKTFVFANPNKSYISIQAFEKNEFELLVGDGSY